MKQDAREVSVPARHHECLARTSSQRRGTDSRPAKRDEIQIYQFTWQSKTSPFHRASYPSEHGRRGCRLGTFRRPVSRCRSVLSSPPKVRRGGNRSRILLGGDGKVGLVMTAGSPPPPPPRDLPEPSWEHAALYKSGNRSADFVTWGSCSPLWFLESVYGRSLLLDNVLLGSSRMSGWKA